MGNIAFAFPSLTKKIAAVSGGDWRANYPLAAAVSTPVRIGYPAISADLDTDSTQGLFVLDGSYSLSVVALVNHNLSVDATWRLKVYSDAAGTVELYDSGDLEAWESIVPFGTVPWGDPAVWNGKPGPEQRAAYVATAFHVMANAQFARSFRLFISDPDNPAGYVSIGHVEAAQWWQSSRNFEYGGQLGFLDRTVRSQSAGGAEYNQKRRNPRQWSGVIRYLPQAEAYGKALEMQRQLASADPVLVSLNPDDPVNRQRLTFLARLQALDGLGHAFYGKHDFPVRIKEVL